MLPDKKEKPVIDKEQIAKEIKKKELAIKEKLTIKK